MVYTVSWLWSCLRFAGSVSSFTCQRSTETSLLISVPSSGPGKDIAPAAPRGKVYLPNAERSSANALETSHEFTIQPSDEDVHTSIENYLASVAGAARKKLHIARSRND